MTHHTSKAGLVTLKACEEQLEHVGEILLVVAT